jgi:uncharacterized repeat protein (TIGR03803 family)
MTRLLEALESRVMLTTVTFTEGYDFTGGADGGTPNAIVVDGNGNVFGTTSTGGAGGFGTFFGIGAAGIGTVAPAILGSLDQTDTAGTSATIGVDTAGDVFGASQTGGVVSNGAIYEVSAVARVPQVIFSFPFGAGGAPSPTLTVDAAGDVFGTTVSGGANGFGQVFELSAGNHNFSTVYSFQSADGTAGPVLVDANGDVFIATTTGGDNGAGTLNEIQAGKHSLTSLGALPTGASATGLTMDASGNIFGVARTGGTNGTGSIFEYQTSTGAIVTLFSFPTGSASSLPNPQIVVDASDNVFGTTANGNTGVAFELPQGVPALTILHTFNDGAPTFGLVSGGPGLLYGLTSDGGVNGEGSLVRLAVVATPPATQLVFSQAPASGAAGTLGTIKVTVEDVNGNVVKGDGSKVTLKIVSGPTGGKITGTGAVNAVNGVATFKNVVITEAGTYTLEAMDGTLTVATTAAFTLAPSTPTHLVFVQQPTTTVAGVAVAPALTVKVEDKNGNVVTTDTSTVTIGVGSKPAGGGIVSGQLSAAAVNGVATFSGLVLDIAGSYTLLATDGVLVSGKSKAFTVNADATTAHLVLTQTPAATAVVGAKLTGFTVVLKDQFGNVVKGNKSSVVVTSASGPAGGKVAGTVNASISSGTVTFKNVTVSEAGTYTLQVADPTLAGVSNVPVTFGETITPGVTSVAAVKPAKSYVEGKTIVLHTTLKSTAPSTVPYSGTATVTDTNGDVLGNVTVSAKGAVTETITDLAAGTYACALTYAGDVDHSPAGSAGFVLVVNPPKA